MSPQTNYRVDYEDLAQQVYRMLKHMILVGELKTGEKLVQDDLAERFGVSRTPLLSAFSKLENEMLVEFLPRRGAYVKKYELSEIVDIYEIRVRLEPLGAAGAAANADDASVAKLRDLCARLTEMAEHKDPSIKEIDYEFHMTLVEMSGNRMLNNIISSFSIIPIANFYGFFKDPKLSALEHIAITDAIAQRDVRAARRAMFIHIDASRRHLLKYIESKETDKNSA